MVAAGGWCAASPSVVALKCNEDDGGGGGAANDVERATSLARDASEFSLTIKRVHACVRGPRRQRPRCGASVCARAKGQRCDLCALTYVRVLAVLAPSVPGTFARPPVCVYACVKVSAYTSKWKRPLKHLATVRCTGVNASMYVCFPVRERGAG